MNKLFVNNFGDLAEAQRASFYRFLSYGISEELKSFPNPFFRFTGRKREVSLSFIYTQMKLNSKVLILLFKIV